jgi:uncharacterized membrane protein required for colicin V production
MNWLDGIFIAVLVIGALVGLWKGIIKLAFIFGGMILGILAASHWYVSLGSAWGGSIGANIAAFFVIFIVITLIVGLVVGRIVERRIRWSPLVWANRLGGTLIGLVIAGAICGFIIMGLGEIVVLGVPGMSHIQQSIDTALKDSAMTPGILRYFTYLMGLLPSQFDAVREWLLH